LADAERLGWEAPRREVGPHRWRGYSRGRLLPPWLARVRPASGL